MNTSEFNVVSAKNSDLDNTKNDERTPEGEGGGAKKDGGLKENEGAISKSDAERILAQLKLATEEHDTLKNFFEGCVKDLKEDVMRVDKNTVELKTLQNDFKR